MSASSEGLAACCVFHRTGGDARAECGGDESQRWAMDRLEVECSGERVPQDGRSPAPSEAHRERAERVEAVINTQALRSDTRATLERAFEEVEREARAEGRREAEEEARKRSGRPTGHLPGESDEDCIRRLRSMDDHFEGLQDIEVARAWTAWIQDKPGATALMAWGAAFPAGRAEGRREGLEEAATLRRKVERVRDQVRSRYFRADMEYVDVALTDSLASPQGGAGA